MLDRPKETPLKTVRVGGCGIWAVGTNNVLYRRSDVLPILPEGREWVRACDGVTQVSIYGCACADISKCLRHILYSVACNLRRID